MRDEQPEDLEAIADEIDTFLRGLIQQRRSGLLSGYVLIMDYLDDHGEPTNMLMTPTQQPMLTSLGLTRGLALDIEDQWLGRDDDGE